MTISFLVVLILLFLPIAFGGIAHMIVVKRHFLSWFNTPISSRLFGPNKTYRGFMCVPIFTALGAMLTQPIADMYLPTPVMNMPFVIHGFIAGFLYVLGELPNSFLKRQCHILPGELPQKGYWVFRFLDTFDSFLPITLYYGFFFRFTFVQGLLALVVFMLLAECIKKGLIICRLK